MSNNKRPRLDKMTTPLLPYDILYLVTEYLSIRDLCILNRTCKSFYLFFTSFFVERKKIAEDFLVPKYWSSLKKYAAIESRTRIFPEARYFYDLTHLLIRCIDLNDAVHYDYFWQEVVKKELADPFNKAISYLLLIEKVLQVKTKLVSLDNLFGRLHYCDEDFLQFIYTLMTVRSGYARSNTLTNIIDRHVSWEYRVDLLERYSPARWPNDRTLIASHLKTIDVKYLPFLEAITSNNNQKLADLLKTRQGYDENFLEAFATVTAICGRKDLYVYLKSYLGFLPFYRSTHNVLIELGCYEMIAWIESNSYPWSKP